LGLPKASVSDAVKQLETAFGVRLLQRTTRTVRLTHDGEVCYRRGKAVLDDMDALEGLFQRGATALEGTLRVDMSLGMARNVVIPRLPEFLRDHPKLHVALSSTDRRVELVREGFDCVLRVGALSDSSLVAMPMGRMTQINCASPGYLAQHGVPHSLSDLARHRLVHYASTSGDESPGFEYIDGSEIRYATMVGNVTVNNSDAYRAACLAGLGLTQVPRFGVEEDLATGRLVEVLPAYRAPPLPVSLLVANRRHLPKRVQAFVAWLKNILAPYVI
jgi:DNA-binding transcriptional LysR family regulator